MKLNVLAMYHPAAALHQPRLWAVMLGDWENLPETVPHDYILVKEHKIYPDTISLDTEQSQTGGLGAWSVAYRDKQDRLCVERYMGARPKKRLDTAVVFHNAKYDLRVLRANKMQQPKEVHDTMIAAYCLGLGRQAPADSAKTKSGSMMVGGLGLKYLARRHLGMEMKTWLEVKDHPEMQVEYNDADSVATYLLFEKWKPKLPEHYFKIDMPLLPVLMAMEDRGMAIDPDYLDTFSKYLDKQLEEIELPLNPYSSLQIHSYIYGTLGIEPWKFTDSGAPSTDADVLESIDDPIVQDILKYRELHKEKGTYADNYVAGSKADERIHTEFKQTSTSTSRLSSARPNLQNVPDPKKGSGMRALFIAPEGKSLVRLDWERMELWGIAIEAEEHVLLDALLRGEDPHQETADFLGIPRHEGRNVNFLMVYRGGAWKISQEFGVPIGRAKELEEGWYRKYPAIREYHKSMAERARDERKVSLWTGRTQRIDAMYAPDWRVRQAGEREAINMPVQGGCAEIVKLAMIDLHYKHSAPMILQCHDELIFEVNKKEAKDYAQWLYSYVPKITPWNGIELPVSVKIGQNWKECSE